MPYLFMACLVAGGTHHAFADRGEGFCVFNDIAVSAHMAMAEQGIERVLVIDLDVHQVRLLSGHRTNSPTITKADAFMQSCI